VAEDEAVQGAEAVTQDVVGDVAEDQASLLEEYDSLAWGWKLVVLGGAVVALAVLFGIWHALILHWLSVHTGTATGTGVYYAFWSGFGSDLGEATLVMGVLAAWRHHSCHVRGCARLGREVPGTAYLACPKHHPGHEGSRRGVSLATIRAAHKVAREREEALAGGGGVKQ
jgi:hypothetical protein